MYGLAEVRGGAEVTPEGLEVGVLVEDCGWVGDGPGVVWLGTGLVAVWLDVGPVEFTGVDGVLLLVGVWLGSGPVAGMVGAWLVVGPLGVWLGPVDPTGVVWIGFVGV